MLVAKYTARQSGVVPTFNSGYQYTVNETLSDEIYIVEIESDSDFTSCSFGYKSQLLTVEYLKVTNLVTNMTEMFDNCSRLTQINTSGWDTSSVISMKEMFYSCTNLIQVDTSNFDTSKVTDMMDMFSGCHNIKLIDCSNWNTSNVTLLEDIFYSCDKITSLDLSSFDTSKFTDIDRMFYGCPNLVSLNMSNWDISTIESIDDVFFYNCKKLNKVILNNTNEATINKIVNLLPTLGESSMGTLRIDETTGTITSSASAKYWNISEGFLVTKYTANASGVVPTFNSGYVYETEEVDNGDGTYTVEIISKSDFTSCSFNGKDSLLTVEYLKVTSNVTSMRSVFYNCSNLTQVDTDNWDTSEVTDMGYMFYYCSKLTQVDVSNFDTSKVTNMNSMFLGCSTLTQIDTDNWDTNKVTNMGHMFYNCSTLTQLDLSNFDTSNVTEMGYMFYNCRELTQLDISTWNINSVTNIRYIFHQCSNLNNIIMNNSDYSSVNKIISNLTVRSSDSMGTLKTAGVDDITQVNTSTANSYYWNIDNKSLVAKYTANESGVVPTFNEGYQYTVNETESNGIYTVEVYSESDFTSCSFSSKSNLLTVEYLKVTSQMTTANGMFYSCSSLTQVDTSNWDTSEVTDMNYMFSYCPNLTQLDVSEWDTSNVTVMYQMFRNCSSLTQLDVSKWDTNLVTNMEGVFYNCSSLTQLDLSNWDISNVTTLYRMFCNCTSLTQVDLSNWDINQVTNMSDMFTGCTVLNNITMNNSNYSSVNNIISQLPTRTSDSMGTLIAKDVDDSSQIDSTTATSKYWSIVKGVLIARYTANASGVRPAFNSGYEYSVIETLNEGIYTVEVYSESDFTNCNFNGKSQLLTVEYLKVTSQVTYMTNMFYDCTSLTQLDVSNWDTSSVTNMNNMFYNCKALTQLDVSNWDVSEVTDMNRMFYNCSNLTQVDTDNWDTSEVTDMGYMFYYCSNLTQVDVSNFDTSSVTTMIDIFYECSSLTQLDLSNFDTSNVTNMNYMFYNCSSLTQLNLSNFDTSKATTMHQMFRGCSSLTQLDVSNFDTSDVTDMYGMFHSCSSLTQLDLSNWDMNKVTYMSNMFANCSVLNNIIMNNSDYSSINKIISELPTRTSDSMGTLNTIVTDDSSQIDSTSATSKYWNVKIPILIARYTANASGVRPTFNSGYQYTVNETVSNGIYTVEINSDSDFTSCSFNGKSSLLTVEYLKVTNKVTSTYEMFRSCSKLTQVDASNWDTSSVTSMHYTFASCSQLAQLNASNWDTKNATNMEYIFYNCQKLTQLDLSNWDTSKVTNMTYMFRNCSNLAQVDVSNFDTSKVTTMRNMFYGCSQLTQLDLSNWDTSSVTNMASMFYDCSKLNNIIATNVSTSTLSKLITELPTKSASSYGTIKATETTDAITSSANAKYWNIVVPMLIARYTTNASGVRPGFNNGYVYEVIETNNGNGTYTVEIISENDFTSCSFTDRSNLLTVEYLKVTNKVTSMYNMFYNCKSLTRIDVSNWDTSKVTNTSYAFYYCRISQLDASKWDLSSAVNMERMFYRCQNLTQLDASGWNVSKVTNMASMFYGCTNLTQLDASGWNVSQVPDMSYLFHDCGSLVELNLSNWNITASNMTNIFNYCSALKDVTMNNSNYSSINKIISNLPGRSSNNKGTLNIKVTDDSSQINLTTATSKNWNVIMPVLMARYTANASGVVPTFNDGYEYETTEVDNGNGTYTIEIEAREDFTSCSFDGKSQLLTVEYLNVTNQVTSMSRMFYGCSRLTQLDTSNWDTSNVTSMGSMFYSCSNLVTIGETSKWDTSETTNMNSMFYGCSSLSQLDVSNFDTSNVTTLYRMFQNCSSLAQLDVSKWVTSNVETTQTMFYGCSKLAQLDVSKWDTNLVTNMNYTFYNCSSLTQLDLSSWNIGQTTTVVSLLEGCTGLDNITMNNSNYSSVNKVISQLPTRSSNSMGTLTIAKVDDMSQIDSSTAESKYWNVKDKFLVARYTANASNIVSTFNEGYEYVINEVENNGIYTVEIESDTDFTSCSFNEKSSLLTVEYLKVTSNVISTENMFQNCTNLTQLDLSSWNISEVVNMNNMFGNCSNLNNITMNNSDYSSINKIIIELPTRSSDSMGVLTILKVDDITQVDTTTAESKYWNVKDKILVAKYTTNASGIVPSFNSECVYEVTETESEGIYTIEIEAKEDFTSCSFSNKSQLLAVEYLKVTNKVTSLNGMFDGCFRLTQLDVSNWDTGNVTTMRNMFYSCNNLTSLDLSSFDTSKVTNIISMFSICSKLTSLDISNWDISTITSSNSSNVFYNCSELNQVILKNTNESTINKIIDLLPTRVSSSEGTLSIDTVTNEIKSSASAKNWYAGIISFRLVARYTANINDIVPTFNNDYIYNTTETVNESIYTVEVFSDNDFTSCSFDGKSQLLTVEYLNVTNQVTSMSRMFYNCSSLTSIDVSEWITSSVEDMSSMFYNCSQLTELNVSKWDTSNVTNMNSMFRDCQSLTSLDLSNFDTVNVTDMNSMFHACYALASLDVSNFNTENVVHMYNIFYDCQSLTSLDLSNFDTVNVTDMNSMFASCSQLSQLDMGNWNTDNAISMEYMFDGCSQLTQLDVSNFDTSNVTNMNSMFASCSQLSQLDVGNWDIGKVTNMNSMFASCSQLVELDLSEWNTSQVTDVNQMFQDCSSLKKILMHNASYLSINKITDVLPTRTEEDKGTFEIHNTDNLSQINFDNDKYWDIITKYSIKYTFDNTLSANLIPTFNTGFVDYAINDYIEGEVTSRILRLNTHPTMVRFGNTSTASNRERSLLTVEYFNLDELSDIRNMFKNCTSVTRIETENWNTSEITDMSTAFQNCTELVTLDVSNWDTSQVTNMYAMFQRCSHLEELDVSEWDTSSVENMSSLFYNCTSLTELNVSKWDASNVISTNCMFYNCSNLSELNVRGFGMSKNTDMGYMFYGCTNLNELNVAHWDIGQVTEMSSMFDGCSSLVALDVGNWNTENVEHMYGVFQNCTELITLDVSNWKTDKVINAYGIFNNCSKITELDVSNWKTDKIEDMSNMFNGCEEITHLDLSGWDTRNVEDMSNMFNGCTALSYLDLSNFNSENILFADNMFQECVGLSHVGLIYSDLDTLNLLPTLDTMTLYVGANINKSQYIGESELKEYIEKKVNINIPVDLKGNGDVVDRLYWDDEDKHYYIEQWIDPLTDEVLETPNIIATSITTPIEIKQFTGTFTMDTEILSPSYLNITVPHFYIPNDYEYDESEEIEYLKQSFELRFPSADDVGEDWGFVHVDGDSSMGLKRVIDWVDNCDDETFVREFDEYFHRQYTLRYFLLVITLGMVDNLGKNMMLDTYDNKIWMPRFYDMDTICSYDNTGQIKFDVDIEMAQGYWNTSASRLWTRIRDLMHNDLVAMYRDMRANGMSYESFMEYFYDEQIAQIPQKYYNMDADVKYLPFADAYIGKAHGDGYEHLKRWLKRRLIFTDTLYDYQPSYVNDIVTIRANTTERMTLEIETYTPVYQHLSWYNGQMDKQKIDGKTSVTFEGFAQASTDQEILIYGGSNIKSIKGISTCNPSQLLIGSATRLIELEAKDCTMLTDINSMGANLLPHMYLNKLDLSGCTALSGNLNIQNSPLLIHLDVSRTGISGINLPSSVKNMERMAFSECPNLTTINMPNLYMPRITNGSNMFKGCTNLRTVDLRGWDTPSLTDASGMFLDCSSLTTLNISNWDTTSIVNMNNMFKGCNLITDVTPPKNLFVSHDISSMVLLTRDEVLEWVGALSLIETDQIIILGSTLVVLLSEEDILAIINKGWSVG